jgi:hypothetical protein
MLCFRELFRANSFPSIYKYERASHSPSQPHACTHPARHVTCIARVGQSHVNPFIHSTPPSHFIARLIDCSQRLSVVRIRLRCKARNAAGRLSVLVDEGGKHAGVEREGAAAALPAKKKMQDSKSTKVQDSKSTKVQDSKSTKVQYLLESRRRSEGEPLSAQAPSRTTTT